MRKPWFDPNGEAVDYAKGLSTQHAEWGINKRCQSCGEDWPCRTRIVADALIAAAFASQGGGERVAFTAAEVEKAEAFFGHGAEDQVWIPGTTAVDSLIRRAEECAQEHPPEESYLEWGAAGKPDPSASFRAGWLACRAKAAETADQMWMPDGSGKVVGDRLRSLEPDSGRGE